MVWSALGWKMRLYLPAEQQVHMLQDEALALPSHRLKSGDDQTSAPLRAARLLLGEGADRTARRRKGRYFEYFQAIRSRSLSQLILITLMWPITVTWSHSCFNYSQARPTGNFRAHCSQGERSAFCQVGARGFTSKTLILVAGSRKIL